MSGLQGVEGISSGRNDNVVGPASKECKGRIGGVSTSWTSSRCVVCAEFI